MSRKLMKRFYAQSARCPRYGYPRVRLIDRRQPFEEARRYAHWMRTMAGGPDATPGLHYLLQESTTEGWNVVEVQS
jgi:hypothetical protein